jgi:hypothetical protein
VNKVSFKNSQAPVEALDEGILNRLSGLDVVPMDTGFGRPGKDRVAGQLSPVEISAARRQEIFHCGDACAWLPGGQHQRRPKSSTLGLAQAPNSVSIF